MKCIHPGQCISFTSKVSSWPKILCPSFWPQTHKMFPSNKPVILISDPSAIFMLHFVVLILSITTINTQKFIISSYLHTKIALIEIDVCYFASPSND